MSDSVVSYQAEAGVGRIVIDRPKALNALNQQVLEELDLILDRLRSDAMVRVVVVSGAGDKAFVAGADIAAMVKFTQYEAAGFASVGQEVFTKLEELPQAVIAQVQGYALGGGCELALACDLIHASRTARFGQPEINLGIIPGFGGTQRLARRIGRSRAADLIWTGATIEAVEAHRIGLVDAVHEPENLVAGVDQLARHLAAKAPEALRQAKVAIRMGLTRSMQDGLTLERDCFAACFAHEDAQEGLKAFLEKRAPNFRGP